MDFSALNQATARTFGEAVEWLDAPARAAGGIFDSRHFEAEGEGQVGVSQLVTTLTVDLADTGAIADGERLTVRGVTYRVADRRPDGQGMTVLVLERAATSGAATSGAADEDA